MITLKTALLKTAAFLKGKKTFIALSAMIAAIGGAGIFAYNKTVDNLNKALTDTSNSDSSQVHNADADQSGVLKDDSLSSELQTILDTQKRVFPAGGEIITEFSDGELVYSETLGVWQTHNGIDIAVKEGDNIVAMTAGEVSRVWEDTLWGYCVTIDHKNTVESHYYGLDANLAVKEGDKVDSGDIIGIAGNTASAEITLPSHIHFALRRNGEWVDPVHFIAPNSHK